MTQGLKRKMSNKAIKKEIDEWYVTCELQDNTTNASDGIYPLILNQFNWHDCRKGDWSGQQLEWKSSSKVIVRSNLIDLESLIQCTKEVLMMCGYHGQFLESVNFYGHGEDGFFEVGIGS